MTILTKAQKELLLILKEKPNYRIQNPSWAAPRLVDGGFQKIKIVNTPLFESIRPWLKLDDKKSNLSNGYVFGFDLEAEITPDWPAKRIERDRQQCEVKEEAKQLAIEAESEKASAWFESIGGTYTVVIQGQWPFNGNIMLGDECIAEIKPRRYSSQDGSFDDIMTYPENVEYFGRVKKLIQLANKNTT